MAELDWKLGKNSGMTQDTGTRNVVFMVIKLQTWAIEVQKQLYACFKEYIMAFNKVWHKELLGMLGNCDLHEKDIQIICNFICN